MMRMTPRSLPGMVLDEKQEHIPFFHRQIPCTCHAPAARLQRGVRP